jgi:hypothetical protein
MESLVVTLETAQKLKAAGFMLKRPTFFYADDSLVANTGGFDYDNTGYSLLAIAPTAQEIADQLPHQAPLGLRNEQLGLVVWPVNDTAWIAAYSDAQMDGVEAEAPTMAEALAALWLKLQEAK